MLVGVSGLQTEVSPSLGSSDSKEQEFSRSSAEHPPVLQQEHSPVWATGILADGWGFYLPRPPPPTLRQAETLTQHNKI